MTPNATYKFKVHISPNARTSSIQRRVDGSLHIHVNAPPEKGKANERLIEIISDWLQISKKEIRIVQGTTSKIKLLEIPDEYKLKFLQKLEELKSNP